MCDTAGPSVSSEVDVIIVSDSLAAELDEWSSSHARHDGEVRGVGEGNDVVPDLSRYIPLKHSRGRGWAVHNNIPPVGLHLAVSSIDQDGQDLFHS